MARLNLAAGIPLVAVAIGCGCAGDRDRPEVRYVAVDVRTTPGFVRGQELVVRIELEALTGTGPTGPHVDVDARCGAVGDHGQAFVAKLSRVDRGERKIDEARLFHASPLEAPPARCDLLLTLVGGATPPAAYCHSGGLTTAGACP